MSSPAAVKRGVASGASPRGTSQSVFVCFVQLSWKSSSRAHCCSRANVHGLHMMWKCRYSTNDCLDTQLPAARVMWKCRYSTNDCLDTQLPAASVMWKCGCSPNDCLDTQLPPFLNLNALAGVDTADSLFVFVSVSLVIVISTDTSLCELYVFNVLPLTSCSPPCARSAALLCITPQYATPCVRVLTCCC